MKLSSELLAQGVIIREPVGNEAGYWAGAPGVFYAADERAWYLTYRIRRPRGVAPDRGGVARIARSTDLSHWEDVWTVTRDKFNSASIERCALRKGANGQWRYFVSFVDPADGRWCVSVIKAGSPNKLDAAKTVSVFKAAPLGLEGIKDPWIYESGGVFYMIVSVAVATASTTGGSHSTLDIFNTGECVSATGLAMSSDLDKWEWQGIVFRPGPSGWDKYCRRINSVIHNNGKYLGFYDGSANHAENYEEKTGLAVSSDLRQWMSLTSDSPVFTSPHTSTSLRYLDAQPDTDVSGRSSDVLLFYEFARPDGAHDLRLIKVPIESLLACKPV